MATPPTVEETRQAANRAKAASDQEKLNEEIQKYNEAMESALNLQIDINNATAEKLRMDIQTKDAKDKANAALKEQVRLEDEILELRVAMVGANAEEAAQWQAEIDANKDLLAQSKELSAAAANDLDTIEKKKQSLKVLTAMQEKYGESVLENLEETRRKTNTVSNALKKFGGRLPLIGNTFTKVLDQSKSLNKLGSDLKNASDMMGDGFAKDITEGMGDFFENMNMYTAALFAIVSAAAKMALEFDNLSKQIGSTTGFSAKFNDTLMKGHAQTMLSGVSMKEYASSITSLAQNFSGFNPTAEKTNQYLATTTSRLEKLGVSAGASSKLMDHFHRAMGVSQEMAADMTAQLVMLGRQVGITASKMAADFQASAGVLARYGKDQIKVFKQLAAQAKATGLEMGTLLGMAEKFDTFEGAADSAAKLNAVLGTQLSTIEMMNMNEADRVKMIKEQVQASVGNFDSLDKFTKMYVAQAMGVKDVAEAQRLLNMSQAETSANAAKMQEQADVQESLAAATAELVPMMQKLKLIGMKIFMVFSPLISAFTGLFYYLDLAYTWFASLTEGMAMAEHIATILKFAFIAVGVAALAFGAYIGWPVAAIVGLIAALGALWDIFHKPGSPSMATGLFEFIGASIARFGEMILLPLKAVGMFADAVTGLWNTVTGNEPTAITAPEIDTSDVSGGFDIQALAEIDTSKVAAGINEIKSAVMELAGIKMDGFLAMHTDGSSSSFIMGSDGLIKSISEGKLIVDVKMPEMKLPEVLVKVFIGDRELKGIIRTEVRAQVGAMG